MSSSTKPPANSRKYQFDTDFNTEQESSHSDPLQDAANEEELPAPRQFSEEELAQERSTAFQAGFTRGLEDAQKSIDATMTSVIDKMLADFTTLLDGEAERFKTAREIALRTSIATIKKIWPQILDKLGQNLVEETLQQSMAHNPEESRLVVRVHDSMLDTIIQRLPQLQAQEAFAGKVIVIADDHVQPGDCKIEWADGGMERLSRVLSVQIDEALERILANMPRNVQNTAQNNSQNADTDRISS